MIEPSPSISSFDAGSCDLTESARPISQTPRCVPVCSADVHERCWHAGLYRDQPCQLQWNLRRWLPMPLSHPLKGETQPLLQVYDEPCAPSSFSW